MTYEEWKARAVAYMASEFALDENGIDDDWFEPDFNAGWSPEQSVDAFCAKYDLTRSSEFTFEQAVDFMGQFVEGGAIGLEELLVGYGVGE